VEEAERRGLPNLRTTVEALDVYVSRKALELFGRHGVLSPTEIASRYEIKMGAYKRAICVEAATMTEMARREILPAGLEWAARLDRLCTPAVKSVAAGELLKRCLKLCDRIHMLTGELEEKLERIKGFRAVRDGAQYARDVIIPKMAELRAAGDELETIMPAELWPIPTYAELLFKV
jgi:glutamine synthetase